jgi:hypothetical protein
MATYIQIGSTVTVGLLGAATIDFTSIPATYTDLLVKLSARSNRAGETSDNVIISFNSSTANLSYRYLQGQGASAFSSSGSIGSIGTQDASLATSSTFGNLDFYVPNYAGSNYKSTSSDSVEENNGTTAYGSLFASLWSNTAAITSISLKPQVGTLFVQYSTASLYGISKS